MDSSRVRIYFDELKRNEINSVWEHNNKRKKRQLEIQKNVFFSENEWEFFDQIFFCEIK